jgi:hypothetical protein
VNPSKAKDPAGSGKSSAGQPASSCSRCSGATKLAALVKNALLNGDFSRALEVLDEMLAGGPPKGG